MYAMIQQKVLNYCSLVALILVQSASKWKLLNHWVHFCPILFVLYNFLNLIAESVNNNNIKRSNYYSVDRKWPL